MHKKVLLENVEKIHTTEMGIGRIQKKLKQDNSIVRKEGKNYYVDVDDCTITINSSSFTIITAHKI